MFFFVLFITNIVVEHRNSCQKSTFFFLLLPYTWLQVVSRSQATSGLQMLQQVAPSSNISSVFTLGNVQTRVVNGLGSLLACNSVSFPSTSMCESQVAKHVIYERENVNTGVAYDTYKSEGFCGLQTH